MKLNNLISPNMRTPVKQSVILTLLLFCIQINIQAQQQTVVIKGGTIINPQAGSTAKNTIVIENGEIEKVAIASQVDVPSDAQIIDATGKFVVPGLFDTHVHFFQSGGLYTRPDILDLRSHVTYHEELSDIKNSLQDTFKRYLRSGITSVADVGGPMWNLEVRRKSEDLGKSPTVKVAGPLISTYQPEALTTDDPPIIKADSPSAARNLVRKQVEENVDFIKIWYIVQRGESPEQHLPVIRAVMDEAHANNKPVLVHATQLETARTAVEAGADILVHSVTDTLADREFIDLLKENNVIYTPTLTVFERYPQIFAQQVDLTLPEHRFANPEIISSLFDLQELPEQDLPRFVKQRMKSDAEVSPDTTAIRNLEKLYNAGVTVAAGTDAGNIGTPHGPALYREFELMKKAGMDNRDILKTATLNGARFLGRERSLGTIEEGKQGDILVLSSNPLNDLKNLTDLHLLVKNGQTYKPGDLLNPSPEEIVQKQVNAYNARDIEAFTYFYSSDVKIYRPLDELFLSGKREIRKRYKKVFNQNPLLHAEIVNRIIVGNRIIDHERVTFSKEKPPTEAAAMYQVEGNKIERVYFLDDL